MIIILACFEEKAHGEKIANILVDEKLAACVTLFPVQSFYYWKGEKMTPNECEAFIKTKEENFSKIEELIKKECGYDIPQLIILEPKGANQSYLEWVEKQISNE